MTARGAEALGLLVGGLIILAIALAIVSMISPVPLLELARPVSAADLQP